MLIEQWNKDPEFKALPKEEKGRILSNYFQNTMVDSEFMALPETEQGRIKNNFLTSEGFSPDLKEPQKAVGLGQQIAGAFTDFAEDIVGDDEPARPPRPHGATGEWDADIQPLKTLDEGTKAVIRNTADFVKGFSDVTKNKIRALQGDPAIQKLRQDPDVIPGFIATSEKDFTPEKDEIANKILQLKALTPEDLARPGGFKGYVQDVIRMAPQIMSQVGVSVAGGPVAGIAFMGTQIAGGHYKQLIDEGVEPERAFLAALADASMQAPLEQIGVSKALRFWKPGKTASKAIKAFIAGGTTEFLTEWIQKYPELAADIWAKGKYKPKDEMFTEFLEGFVEATKEGFYEGLVAAPFGAVLGGAGAKYRGSKVKKADKDKAEIEEQPEGPSEEALDPATKKIFQETKDNLDSGRISPSQLKEIRKTIPDDTPTAVAIDLALKEKPAKPKAPKAEEPTTTDFKARKRNQEKIKEFEAEQEEDQRVEKLADIEGQVTQAGEFITQKREEEGYWKGVEADIKEQQKEGERAKGRKKYGARPTTLQQVEVAETAERQANEKYWTGVKADIQKQQKERDKGQPTVISKTDRRAAKVPAPEKTEIALEGAGTTIDVEANKAATSPDNKLPEPTVAQQEAGNYQKGHVSVQGMEIAIENPKGSQRKGVSPEGKKWSIEMKHHYGYFNRTEGKDGDQIDTFVGPDIESPNVYIVDQVEPGTAKFDEHKVMTGFLNKEAAKEGYLANYEKGWQGLGDITEMPIEKFKNWLSWGKQKRPAGIITKDDVIQPKPGEATVGYSTHGEWVDSKKIHALESERDNIVDDELLKPGQKAIWITRKPEDAVRYNRSASDWDLEEHPVKKEELESLETVDLSNAKHIKSMDDGDGGELWIIPQKKPTEQPKPKKIVQPPASEKVEKPKAPKAEKVAGKPQPEPMAILPEHGKGLKYESEVQIAETGEVVKVKEDAGQALEDIDERILSLKILRDCI